MKPIVKYLAIGVAAIATVSCTSSSADPEVTAVRDLAGRVVPSIADNFKFVTVADTVDRFTLYQDGIKVVIEGNNANSMAMGLNYYLKQYCLTEVSWYRNEPIMLPEVMPAIDDTVSVTALVPRRFFLNYCTFGYTMPWWSWQDWEHFIDWMALNGINLPLAITGQEAIWYNVWSKLGLTDEEIRTYFTGPAHLPWHRMCNLDYWQGPLPKEWLEEQAELQKKIVDRERTLNMTPVLPGFAGHVPAALKRVYPDAHTSDVGYWGGFPSEYNCTYLSPTDSLFAVIQRAYLEEQTRLYGTDHIYGIDPFNEVAPPTWNPDSLADISRGIYESVAAVDPEATWLQMAWLFWSDPEHWTQSTVEAYLTGVPQGRMILLDYYCEVTEEWKLFNRFYGQPYIWCYLGNFGGNSFLAAPFNDIDRRISDVLANGGDNLCGIGSTLEGFDVNPYMYEYVLSRAWKMPGTHADALSNIIDRRVGATDRAARDAWQLLVDSIFIEPSLCGQGTLTNARPSLEGFSWWTTKPNIGYANSQLVDAWGMLLNCPVQERDAYRFDIINLGRQAMGNYFMALRDDFTAAYNSRDIDALTASGDRMKELMSDLTKLLRGHSGYSLQKWIDDARAKGVSPELKDYYERNARTLVTIWGVSVDLNDYANRQWAELNDAYYAPRWAMFVDDVTTAVRDGKTFDKDAYFNKIRDFENSWIEVDNRIEYLEPLDAVEVAGEMYNKYAPLIKAHPASGGATDCISLHHW